MDYLFSRLVPPKLSTYASLGGLTYSASLETEDMPFGTMTESLTLRSDRFSLPHGDITLHPLVCFALLRKNSSSGCLVFIHRESGIQSSGVTSHSVLSSWVIWVCPWSTLSGADAIRETGCFPRSLKETGMLSLYHTAPCSSEQTACFLQCRRRQLE